MDTKNISMNEELKKLDEAEKAWNEKLNKEIKSEEDILSLIEETTNSLFLSGKTRAIIDNKRFIVGSKVTNLPEVKFDTVTNERKQVITKTIVLIVTNEDRYKLMGQKYIPAMVKADYDERYDAKANIRAAVEGWVRHVTDTVKPEMLDK